MSTSLTPTQITHIIHAEDPYKLLQQWGLGKEEAIRTFWEVCTSREDDQLQPLLQGCAWKLLRTSAEASIPHRLAFLDIVLAIQDNAELKQDQLSWSLSIIRSLDGEIGAEQLPQIALLQPHTRGLLLLYLLAAGMIQQIPPGNEEGFAYWLFLHSSWLRQTQNKIDPQTIGLNEQTWHLACLQLAERHSIVEHHQFPHAALAQAPQEQLFAIALSQSLDTPALTEALIAVGPALIEWVEAEIFPLETNERFYALRGQALLPAYLSLLLAEGRQLPEDINPWLHKQFHSNSQPSPDKIQEIYRYLMSFPVERQTTLIERVWHGNEACWGHFGRLGEAVLRRAIELFEEDPPRRWSKECYAIGFARGGDTAVELISEALQTKLSAPTTQILSAALRQIDTPQSTAVLRELLGHRSKVIREDAAEGLSKRGTEALVGLEEALLARKKPTREAALRVLLALRDLPEADAIVETVLAKSKDDNIKAALQPPIPQEVDLRDGPIAQMHAFIDSVGSSTLEELSPFVKEWPDITGTQEGQEVLDRFGLAALLYEDITNWPGTVFWRDAAEHWIDDPLAPWLIAHRLLQLEHKGWDGFLRHEERFGAICGERLVEPLCALPPLEHPHHQQNILAFLAGLDPIAAIPKLIQGLKSKKKSTQQAAQEGLFRAGEAAVSALIEALSDSKKAARLGAVHVLRQIGSPKALEALQEALGNEKTSDVKAAMQSALNAADTDQQDALRTATRMEREEYLKGLPKIQLPDFFESKDLPLLYWTSGEVLTAAATEGWLALLAQETPQTPNSIARILRAHMDPTSLDAFGQWVYQQWEDAGQPTGHRWMRWQMSISTSPANLYERGWRIPSSDYALFATHGSRLAALLLMASSDFHAPSLGRLRPPIDTTLFQQNQPTAAELDALRQEQRAVQLPVVGQAFQDTWEIEEKAGKDKEIRYTMSLRLRATSFAPLGAWNDNITVDLVAFTIDESTDPALKPKLLRKAQVKHKHLLHRLTDHLGIYPGYIDALHRCSVQGWQRLFTQNPQWRLCGQSLLFQTENDERFMMSLDGTPVNADGEPMALDPYGFVYLISPDALTKSERKRWEDRHADLKAAWKDAQPEVIEALLADADPLLELRALLYEEPTDANWQAVCDLLESWPEDESLELAISYIEAHAEGHWGQHRRVAPAHWLLSVFPTETSEYKEHLQREGKLLRPQRQALLRACDHIDIPNTRFDKEDLQDLLSSPHLSNIKGLSLTTNELPRGAGELLLSSPFMSQLTRFELRGVSLRAETWRQLPKAGWIRNITHLALRHNRFDWQKLQSWLKEGAMDGLVSLDLTGNPIALPGIQMLLAHEGLRDLKELCLDSEGLHDDGIQYLAENNTFASLETLRLQRPSSYKADLFAGESGIKALANSPLFPQLKQIFLEGEQGTQRRAIGNVRWLKHLLEGTGLPQRVRDDLREAYKDVDLTED